MYHEYASWSLKLSNLEACDVIHEDIFMNNQSVKLRVHPLVYAYNQM